MSSRAKRMQRMNKLRKQPALNLVSLMDIFTILVFFLLVSSSSQQLPSTKNVKLPTSTTKSMPKETLMLMITEEHLIVEGRSVGKIEEISQSPEKVIPGLKKELDFLASRKRVQTGSGSNKISSNDGTSITDGLAITIVGDENMPYELLSKVLTTCRQSSYTKIAFLANQKAKS